MRDKEKYPKIIRLNSQGNILSSLPRSHNRYVQVTEAEAELIETLNGKWEGRFGRCKDLEFLFKHKTDEDIRDISVEDVDLFPKDIPEYWEYI